MSDDDKLHNFVPEETKEQAEMPEHKDDDDIHVHSDLASLHKLVPKEVLPNEYGGEAGSVSDINKQWYEKVVSYKDWFISQEKIKTDESKRPGKPKTYDDLFGMEGSFKQLTID